MKKTASILRSLLSSDWLIAIAAVLGLWLAQPAEAQGTVPILIIDQDRLFSETKLGVDTLANMEAEAQALATENKAIEAELIAEEKDLTARKAAMDPEAFRELADAFDMRVQKIREQQDEKARLLNRTRDEARTQFFRDVAAIISGIVREKGALIVLDRRDVFLSADSIDITDEAIRRVNENTGQSSE